MLAYNKLGCYDVIQEVLTMALKFIIGRSGYGKTHECLSLIAKNQYQNIKNNLIFIVPEQFSLQAEKDIIKETTGKGIMQAKVLSFNRLAYTVFSQTGYPKTQPLTDTSKAMALKKIILENKDDLQYFKKSADKQGFMQQLSTTVSELFRYDISGNKLLAIANATQNNDILKMKLSDLALIYNSYKSFIDNGYISSDEALDLLYEHIDSSKLVKGADIWLDGFYGYTPQELKIIGRLLVNAASVTVTLTMDSYALKEKSLPMTNVFFETKETYLALCKLAKDNNVDIEEPLILTGPQRFKSTALASLEKEFTKAMPSTVDETNDIEILTAPNAFDEAETVALKIISLVRDKGLRYRDIAILAGSLEGYESILRTVMSECKIPFFMDSKQSITNHPLVELIKGILEIFLFNYSYDSVFSFLKTGLTPMAQQDIEILENYCLAYGIKSYKWNFEKWSYGLTEGENSEKYLKINSLKDEFLSFLSPIKNCFAHNKKCSVSQISTAVFTALETMGVAQKLLALSDKMELEGNIAKAYENRQCWNIVMDILDSMNEVLGESVVTLKDYFSLFDSGLSVCQMGIIPPGIDNIIIGTLERTRLPKIKALFIMGMNDGVIPSPDSTEGILSDDERESLETDGVSLAHDGTRRAFEEHYLIYSAITKAENYLTLTYSSGDLSGKALLPSVIINKILNIFTSLKVQTQTDDPLHIFSSPAIAFHHLGQGLTEENNALWLASLKYFETAEEWDERTRLLKEGLANKRPDERLKEDTTKEIFGDTLFSSISKLERFSSCPYSYFMSYTMKAAERPVYQLSTPDLGRLFHSVLEDFSYNLQENKLNWQDLDKGQITTLVTDAVDRQAPSLGNEILLSSHSLMYLVKRLKRISVRAIYTLAMHLKNGSFQTFAYELGFGVGQQLPPIAIDLKDGKKMLLTGKIDRVDILNKDGTTYVKIIDYKSGSKKFDLSQVYYGLQLQLLIYMDALIKNGQSLLGDNIAPAGVFYFRIKDPMLSADGELDAEEIEALITAQLSMSGLVVMDEKIVRAMDNSITRTSKIIPVGYKASGGFTSASSVADVKSYKQLCDYSITSARIIGEKIKAGNIQILPYKEKGRTPCSYCPYLSVCGFETGDPNFNCRNLKPLGQKAILEKIKDTE
ncbi:MAG TPA: helicase-exonuclease AddAB subunit AddB [Lachnospiraceae bacterium]|nr:helicase-exonuclease AddAB subunit AddB [Lachnospiraceae bacterium]